jgi:sulfate/thiosulfate-binding protein
VHLSLEPDMQALVDAGIVDSSWQDNQYHGIVQDSVVTFVVRKGNPNNIQTWEDVVKPGVEVVTPNVFSSGGAKWNLMAAYGAQINQGKSPAEALAFLKSLLGHAVVQPGSASDALTAFTSGKGDVLLSYESDALEAQEAGEDIDYVVPDDTILIETPAATTNDASTQAQDFLTYLWTPEAQQLWADGGYRPVDKSVLAKNKGKFPVPPGLFDIASLGGWEKANPEFFDPENGSVAQIEKDLGVATG